MTDRIEPVELDGDEKHQLAHRLVDQAREQGVDLVGPDGFLTGLTTTVLETVLEEEIDLRHPVDVGLSTAHSHHAGEDYLHRFTADPNTCGYRERRRARLGRFRWTARRRVARGGAGRVPVGRS